MTFRVEASAIAALSLVSSMIAVAWQAPVRQLPRPAASSASEARGIIRGRVLAADTNGPLRRARVTLESERGPSSRQNTSTGLDGRFEFTGLGAGRYKVSVTRGGYLSLEYGQRRPGEQGRPVQLAEEQTVENVEIALPRMSVISGRVTDEFGDPIEGVAVHAMRSLFFDGRKPFVPVNLNTTTDDVGEYRIPRLAPGTYTVMASTRETWVVTQNGTETTFGYLPTYFPGTGSPADAQRVTVGVGQVVAGTDFSLVPGRAPRVSGFAMDSRGQPFARVNLREEVRGLDFGSFRGGPNAAVNPDGSFTIPNVPPGEYVLTASRRPGESQGEPEVAELPLTVDTVDIDNVTLVGSRGGTVSGQVLTDGPPLPKPSSVRISILEPTRGQPSPTLLGAFRSDGGFATTSPGEDGRFSIAHVFGRARFQVVVPDGWMVKSVQHEGRDISDAPLELSSGETISGVRVVLTDRVTRLSGHLVDRDGTPLRDATVLVFPSDPERWFETSRRMRAVRPDQRGEWEIRGLPAGEYLAVALDYVDVAGWIDPDYLEPLRALARPVTIQEASEQIIPLTLAD